MNKTDSMHSKISILITGANFNNKGAQSMLFITVSEIRKRFPNSNIYFETLEIIELANYKFDSIRVSANTWEMLLGGIGGAIAYIKRFVKDSIRFLLGERKEIFTEFHNINILKKIDYIIDISGFALGDKWDYGHNYLYILRIKAAKKYNIPFFILPQSFGPFLYYKRFGIVKSQKLLSMLKDNLDYPQIIYAREKDGIRCLDSIGVSKNVRLSTDLVLQSVQLDFNNLFYKPTLFQIPVINTKNNIGIIPNIQCSIHCNENFMLKLYYQILTYLERYERNIYIVRHSNDDKEVCKKIYNLLKSNRIHLINEELSCFQYDGLIKEFDYIIGSRFHGLVHALKNKIPCIAIGWSVKYIELMSTVGLENFAFDINTLDSGCNGILDAIKDMNDSFSLKSETISDRLVQIQKDNCFSFLDRLEN